MILLLFGGVAAVTVQIETTLPALESALTVNSFPLEWLVEAGGGWSVADSGEWPATPTDSEWVAASSPQTWDADTNEEWEVR